jgi:hypothetical protein
MRFRRWQASPGKQRGVATLMAAVLLLVVLAFGLGIALNLTTTDIADSSMHNDSVEGLLIAESGLENAIRRLTDASAACDGTLVVGPIALGRGEFTVAAGQTTDFGGAPLPAGQCRVQVTGRVALSDSARTVEAIVAIGGGGGGIAVDASNNRGGQANPSLSWNHQVSGIERLLVVGVSIRNSPAQTVSSVTYNGIPLTPIGAQANGNQTRVELWYLLNPPTGNLSVNVTLAPGNKVRMVGGSVSFTGVNQTTPLGSSNFNSGGGATASVSVTTTVNNAWIMDTVASTSNLTMTPAPAGRTQHWNRHSGGNPGSRVYGGGSTFGPQSPPGVVTLQWTASNWAIGAVPIRPAGGASSVVSWREVPRP